MLSPDNLGDAIPCYRNTVRANEATYLNFIASCRLDECLACGSSDVFLGIEFTGQSLNWQHLTERFNWSWRKIRSRNNMNSRPSLMTILLKKQQIQRIIQRKYYIINTLPAHVLGWQSLPFLCSNRAQ